MAKEKKKRKVKGASQGVSLGGSIARRPAHDPKNVGEGAIPLNDRKGRKT